MFRSFFGIKENPFSNTPDPRYVFMSRRHQEALAHLVYGVQGGNGFVLLTGEVGTGKTTISRCLVEQLPKNVDMALCINPRLNEFELLATICDEMGVFYPILTNSIKTLMDKINRHLIETHARGRRAVLIIDEAQNLAPRVLEQVRLLTNLETASAKLLQIILIGQPELKELLGRVELRQVNQRITARYHLDPLNIEEARAYIRHRLKIGGPAEDIFRPGAVTEIFKRSHGVPRLINSICERCLLGAYAKNVRYIDEKLARSAADDVLGFPRRRSVFGRIAAIAAVIAASALFVGLDPLHMRLNSKLSPSPPEAQQPPAIERPPEVQQPPAEPAIEQTAQNAPAEISIEYLFRNPELAGDISTAMSKLFAMWKVEYVAPGKPDLCAGASYAGIRCLRWHGDWQALNDINRPALISLAAGEEKRIYAVVTALDGNNVTIDVGGGKIQTDTRNLTPFWSGDYMMLWKPPPGYWRVIRPGMKGKDVAWLRDRLSEIQGEPIESDDRDSFDEALKIRLISFQRSRKLIDDGAAGALTLTYINTLIKDPATPVLRNQ
ncbi:MAG: hypothetical protein A3G18_11240 [Rhodospirillales bacterium RIFCSPLOWO2_12_FULL_58_28]|nr:MAG: hypothetical protein A3H92_10385 [Rhodospirillales bacterium RIFCSPLOWO2_02_FULL_58_16]OHC77766.1 MAG: hypothetical protein A3G18_11240 [Rhodospirillales bacterium RIFCSPLOWO2_12_FULL_58_28]